nr:MAG TPA: tail collar fiber protein [Caudoviricetes sp.]
MAIFKDTTITDNGRALIASALGNNKQITFTRMVTSGRVYSDTTDISKLINIDEIKQTVNLSRVSQEGTKVRLNAIFTNVSVNSAYKIETIGLYGKIDSGNEILYSVTRAAEADTMPATNGINLATVEIDLITEINNSNGATMQINPSTLVTLSTLQDYIKHEEKMNWMGTNGYGGLLQDAGTKKVGIAYYDKANKQMVVPTVENNLTYFEGSKFIPISDYQNAKKLENLYKVQKHDVTVHGGGVNFKKYGKVVVISVEIQRENITFTENSQLINSIPDGFKPNDISLGIESALASNLTNGKQGATRMRIERNSLNIWGCHTGNYNVLKGSITYFTDN